MAEVIVRILLFKRVCPKDELTVDCITPDLFERILVFLAANYTVITLEDYFFKERNKFSKPLVILTFDNDYRDFIDYSLPLLKKYNMPATLFINSKIIEGQKPHWDHLLDILFLKTTKLTVERMPFSIDFDVASSWKNIAQRRKYGNELKYFLQWVPLDKRNKVIDFYSKQFDDVNDYKKLILSWEELLHVRNQGIVIGTHMSNNSQSKGVIENKQLEKELRESTLIMREKLGHSPAMVSFDAERNNSKVKNIIHIAGYKLGLAVGQNIYLPTRYGRYSVPRIKIKYQNFLLARLQINGIFSRAFSLFSK